MDTGLVIEGWLSVAEAAERLGISVQRVRQLLHAGELDGRKGPGGWIVAENAVRRREQAPPAAGRPLSSHMAWLVVAQLLAADRGPESGVDLDPDRRDRYRLRNLLVHRGHERDWANWLSRRADVAQYWVHPGVIQSVLNDERISVSGAGVAAAAGAEIVGGDVSDLYLSSEAVSGVIDDCGLQSDPAGHLRIHLWRPGSGAENVLRPGKPVPVILAALDLLSAPDSRARHWASAYLQQKMEGMPILRTRRRVGPHSGPVVTQDGRVR
jgi:excisionase family DNA binding protein